ncbi:MAG: DUF389 domain-containing protein [Bryobacteraceae bacterium]
MPAGRHAVHLEKLLGITAADKRRVDAQIFEATELGSLNYWLELVFSAGIATFGLVLNSPVVVIGAMLISPLMEPIMAAGLGFAAADLYLGVRAALNLVVSVAGAVLFAAFLVWLLPFHAATAEILNRTQPNLLDLGVALFSGLVGSLVVARSPGAGAVTALPGVAIAVALMPPLYTVGFGVGSGFQGDIISGASLLFLTKPGGHRGQRIRGLLRHPLARAGSSRRSGAQHPRARRAGSPLLAPAPDRADGSGGCDRQAALARARAGGEPPGALRPAAQRADAGP